MRFREFLACSMLIAASIAGSVYASVPEELTKKASEIDSNLMLTEYDESTLIVGSLIDKDADADKTVRRFMWDAVQMLTCDDLPGAYSSVAFELTDLDRTYTFTANFLEDDYQTISPGSGMIGDIGFYYLGYYKLIFSTHDSVNMLEKKLYDLAKGKDVKFPESYNYGPMWVFKHFGYACGYETKGDRVCVTILRDNTEAAGAETKELLSEAVADFSAVKRSDPGALKYDGYKVEVLDSVSMESLLVLSQNVLDDKIENVEASGTGDFLVGFKK